MPTPKYRTSASKRDMRRSHHALTAPSSSVCPNCQEVKVPHAACRSCGHYRGKQVFEVKSAATSWNGEGLEPDGTQNP